MFYNPEECIADIKKLIRVHKANQPVKIEMPSDSELESNARDILLTHTQPYVKAYAKVDTILELLDLSFYFRNNFYFRQNPVKESRSSGLSIVHRQFACVSMSKK